MKSIKLLIAILCGTLLFSCEKTEQSSDVSFAKKTFAALVRGDSSVASDIDWETFTSLGIPVGPSYIAIQTEPQKDAFRKGFITQFSASFRDSGGSIDSLTNWRATFHDKNHTEVRADSAQGALVLTVSEKDSGKKLSSMQMIK